jgi:hypothetical protein
MQIVGIFYCHLEYFTDFLYILWFLGAVCGHLAPFTQFWYVAPRKIWQPCSAARRTSHYENKFRSTNNFAIRKLLLTSRGQYFS